MAFCFPFYFIHSSVYTKFNLVASSILSKIKNERVASNNKNREEKVMAFCGENTFCIRNSRLLPQKDCCTTQKTKVQNILRRFTMHSGTEKAIKCQIWQKIDLDYYTGILNETMQTFWLIFIGQNQYKLEWINSFTNKCCSFFLST